MIDDEGRSLIELCGVDAYSQEDSANAGHEKFHGNATPIGGIGDRIERQEHGILDILCLFVNTGANYLVVDDPSVCANP